VSPSPTPPSGAASEDEAVVAVATFEARDRLRMTGLITILLSLLGAMYVWLGPQLVAGDPIQEMLDAMPPLLNELMGFESLQSIAGLLASEYYTLGWIVGLGGYVAYSAAARVAGDLETARMDTMLAAPVSRRSVLLGTYLALLVPILVINVLVPIVLYLGSVVVGEPLSILDLAVLHALSVPYLLVWGAVGLLLGVLVRGGRRAGRLALGLVFLAWLFESIVGVSDFAWVGGVSPVRYFDPPAVLVEGTYDVLGAVSLFAVTVALLAVALRVFDHRDF
jgi:ABC-2 type transport system permease protein